MNALVPVALRQLRFDVQGWEWPDVDDDDDSDTEITPAELVEPIRDFFGGEIDVDPCAHRLGHVQARCEWRKSDDGMAKPWVRIPGYRRPMRSVFVNHPYSHGEPNRWLGRCASVASAHPDVSIVALSKGDTSTLWYRKWIRGTAAAVCFVERRIAFEKVSRTGARARQGAKWPSILSYWGPHAHGFVEWFGELGHCIALERNR